MRKLTALFLALMLLTLPALSLAQEAATQDTAKRRLRTPIRIPGRIPKPPTPKPPTPKPSKKMPSRKSTRRRWPKARCRCTH